MKDLFEWLPNGERNGPELVIEAKGTGDFISGKFGVQCGKSWLFAIYGGGFTLDQATGMLTGTASYPAGSIGMGSSYRNAEINFFDFKSAGPVTFTLDAQTSAAAAVGTLSLKRYSVIAAHGRPPHRTKARKLLTPGVRPPIRRRAADARGEAAALVPRCARPGELEQLVERRRERLDGVALERQPVRSERLVGLADRQLAVEHARADRARAPCASPPAPRRRRTGPCSRRSTAAGLARAAASSAIGRETQSSAFLSTPGIEPLYSGVAISTASAAAIAAFRRRDRRRLLVLVVLAVRRDLAPSRSNTTSSTPGGSSSPRAAQQARVVRVAAQAA